MKRVAREYWFEPTSDNTGWRPIHWKGWVLAIATPVGLILLGMAKEMDLIDMTSLIVGAIAIVGSFVGLAIWRCDWPRR